jgi:hypothetical protein
MIENTISKNIKTLRKHEKNKNTRGGWVQTAPHHPLPLLEDL